MSQCPFCVETVPEATLLCPHCSVNLGAISRVLRAILWAAVFGFLLVGAYYLVVGLQPGSLGKVLIERLLWGSSFTLVAFYLGLVHGFFRKRRSVGIGLWLTSVVLVAASAVYARCWNEMRGYRSNVIPLLSRLEYLQQKARHPGKPTEEVSKLQGDWSKFSRIHSATFSRLPSYKMLEQSSAEFVKAHDTFRGTLANRWNSVSTDISAMKRSTDYGPQAVAVYKFELKKAQKVAAAKILLAKKKLNAALAAAESGLRRIKQAQHGVNEAEKRVNRAYDNSTRAILGDGNVFSAEFNSNRNPSQAYNYLDKCRDLLTEANEAGRKLAETLDSARTELGEVESSAQKEAEEKAEEARQKIQTQVDRKRFAAKQEEMNQRYAEWFQASESSRLANLDRVEAHCSQAKLALEQESPWQLIR